MPALTRVLGAVTAAYSATIIVAPRVLAKPCGLTTPAGEVTAGVRTLIAGIGARDAAIGLAMLFAPEGKPLQVALAARVASDAADAPCRAPLAGAIGGPAVRTRGSCAAAARRRPVRADACSIE